MQDTKCSQVISSRFFFFLVSLNAIPNRPGKFLRRTTCTRLTMSLFSIVCGGAQFKRKKHPNNTVAAALLLLDVTPSAVVVRNHLSLLSYAYITWSSSIDQLSMFLLVVLTIATGAFTGQTRYQYISWIADLASTAAGGRL
ncbi:hypothetical protein QTP88_003176 [Uroleucon formosanum]